MPRSIISLVAGFISAAAMLAVVGAATEQSPAPLYANGLPTSDSYFPIALWLQSPSRVPEYEAIGINLFDGLYEGSTEEQLAELNKYDMPVIAEQNDIALSSPNARVIRGWTKIDQPDNAQPPGSGFLSFGYGLRGICIPAKEVANRSAEVRSRDPTRPILIGFGRCVADPNWNG